MKPARSFSHYHGGEPRRRTPMKHATLLLLLTALFPIAACDLVVVLTTKKLVAFRAAIDCVVA